MGRFNIMYRCSYKICHPYLRSVYRGARDLYSNNKIIITAAALVIVIPRTIITGMTEPRWRSPATKGVGMRVVVYTGWVCFILWPAEEDFGFFWKLFYEDVLREKRPFLFRHWFVFSVSVFSNLTLTQNKTAYWLSNGRWETKGERPSIKVLEFCFAVHEHRESRFS